MNSSHTICALDFCTRRTQRRRLITACRIQKWGLASARLTFLHRYQSEAYLFYKISKELPFMLEGFQNTLKHSGSPKNHQFWQTLILFLEFSIKNCDIVDKFTSKNTAHSKLTSHKRFHRSSPRCCPLFTQLIASFTCKLIWLDRISGLVWIRAVRYIPVKVSNSFAKFWMPSRHNP